LSEGKIALFGNGEEKRDHVFIHDVVRLIALAIQHRSEGALNLATGVSVSFAEVAEQVVAVCGGTIRIEHLPRGAGQVTHRHFDITAMLKVWPDFRYTPLADGIAQTWSALAADRD
jgi:nucleoside-diphosphate-sugar epimerase